MKRKRNMVNAGLTRHSWPRIVLVAGLVVAIMGYVVMQTRAATNPVGDLNSDGTVNVFDLSILLSNWGKTGAADLNNDGTVNIFDLSVLLSHWGQSASPTPTVTPTPSPTATPSPTPTGVPLTQCTNPIFQSADPQGSYPTNQSSPYANNNVWNTSEAGPQTIYVCNPSSFYVVANQPDLANDRGAVKSYPSVCQCNLTKPLNQYTKMTSTFGESIPAMGEWNATYDIFMASGIEVMVDNETHNHPPQDGTPVTIDGVPYHALRVGTSFIVLGMDNFQKSGTLNFLKIFQWLESQGWVQATDAPNLFGYGVEISYTESSPGVPGPERFDIENFTLTTN